MSDKNILVELHKAGFKQNNKWLVEGVSLKVEKGKIVTLIGPNGSGKSTTAKIALGIYKNIEGSVEKYTNKIGVFEIVFEDSKGITELYQWYTPIKLHEQPIKVYKDLSFLKDKHFHYAVGLSFEKENTFYYTFMNDNWLYRTSNGYILPNLPDQLFQTYVGQPYDDVNHIQSND